MSAQPAVDIEQQLVDEIAQYQYDPLGFVQFVYQWGEGDLRHAEGPREWQAEILSDIRDHLSSPKTRHQPLLEAVASGHGIGKSALVSWITHWGLSTLEDTKIVITANTKTQLDTKTQTEIAKWFRLSINSHWFSVNVTSVRAVDKDHEQTWRADLIPWSKQNPEAFAGAHNQGKRIIVIFDEASGIDDIIWQTIEGALTDEETEIIFLAFGNPTQNTGRFHEVFHKLKHRWKTRQIDSRTVDGTNKVQIQKWAEDYGEDSDFFRIRVRGEFPRAGSNQFIPSDIVAAARKYKATGYEFLPKVLSVDVARFGDDQTVIGMRQGRKFRLLAKLRGLDNVQVAFRVTEWIDRERPDATVIDGDGLGAGVVDQIRHRGYDKRTSLFEFHGGGTPRDPNMYFNRRAEIWGDMREWLRNGAEIPDDPELETDLTGPFYGCAKKTDAIQLESKDDMKARGLASPDSADCLAMTFAEKIAIKVQRPQQGPPKRHSAWS